MNENALKKDYIFSRSRSFWGEPHIVINIIIWWAFAAIIIYAGHVNNPYNVPLVLLYILALYFMFYASGIRHLYYRFLMFRYNDKTTLSIDTMCKTYTYTHNSYTITFTIDDIDKWWVYEFGPGFVTYVEIIEIRLKSGEKIVISSGLDDAICFIRQHSKELGMPQEYPEKTYDKFLSFRAYIDEIS